MTNRFTHLALIPIFAVACGEVDDSKVDETGSAPIDSGDTGSQGKDTGDTEPPPDITLGGTLTAPENTFTPSEAFTIALLSVDIASEKLNLGDVWVSSAIDTLASGSSTEFSFDLPGVPDDTLFYPPSPDTSPDAEVASFLLGAWVDADEDNSPDIEESYVAASTTLLIYCRGAVLPSLADIGAQAGYNLVQMNLGTGSRFGTAVPVGDGDTSWAVEANMLRKARGPLIGSIVPSFSQTTTVQIYSNEALAGILDPEDPSLYTTEVEPGSSPVSFSVPAPLPDSQTVHFTELTNEDGDFLSIKMASYRIVAFDDLNSDGQWNEGEEFASSFTAGDESRGLIYLRGTGFQGGLVIARQGVTMGWSVYTAANGATLDAITSWGSGVILDDVGKH